MRILPLADNALFMKSWRERVREHVVLAYSIMAISVIGLIFISSFLSVDGGYHNSRISESSVVEMMWLRPGLYWLAVAQGILIFILGLSAVYRTTSLENQNKTLDFHRVSPTSRLDQVLGLVLGAPVLEVVILLGTLGISLIVALLSHVNLFVLAEFYMKFTMTVILWYLLVTLLALIFSSLKIPSGQLLVFILFYFLLPAFYFLSNSFVSELTPFPAYTEFYNAIVDSARSEYQSHNGQLLYSFYGIKMLPLIAQAVVQIPLIVILVLGIIRRITYPQRPVFSKIQFAILSFFIFFIWTGSAVSASLAEGIKGYQHYYTYWDVQGAVSVFTFFVFGLGILGAINTTPNLAQLTKGMRRVKKLGKIKFSGEEDESPSNLWQASFILMAGTFLTINICLIQKASMSVFLGVVIALSQLVFFFCLLQSFRLSKHYQKKSWLIVFLAVLWILLPVLGLILQGAHVQVIGFFAASPFYTLFCIQPSMQVSIADLKIVAGINLILAICVFVIDIRQRSRLIKELSKLPEGSNI